MSRLWEWLRRVPFRTVTCTVGRHGWCTGERVDGGPCKCWHHGPFNRPSSLA